MQMLRDAVLYRNDYEQSREGFTLAAALLFGKDLTIQNLLPAYKVEAMVRIKNKDRWDDRLTLRTNLIDTYLKLKEFINRHLPEKFYMENDQRIDLRDKIFREIIGNIIVHREYTDATATELIIEEDAVRTLNPNNPCFNGVMDLDKFNPHPKNPNIRKFFTALGWTDEIGSGIRNTRKYLPHYVEKTSPVFIDEPLFRTIIPLTHYTMSNFTGEWLKWLELDEKWLPKLAESLKNIEIDKHLHRMSWEERIAFLVSCWIGRDTEFVPGLSKLGTKSIKSKMPDNQKCNNGYVPSPDESRTKSESSPIENITGLPDKKLQYIIIILLISGSPISRDELTELFAYKNVAFFRQNYLKPLETNGFIKRTNPEKPTASNQKYVITEKGKQFIAGHKY
jgi:ATP-dependent DNA helicase RecG